MRVTRSARLPTCEDHRCQDSGARAYAYSRDVVRQEVWLSSLTACGDFGVGPDTGGIERTVLSRRSIPRNQLLAGGCCLRTDLSPPFRTGPGTSSFVGLGFIRTAACMRFYVVGLSSRWQHMQLGEDVSHFKFGSPLTDHNEFPATCDFALILWWNNIWSIYDYGRGM